MAMGLVGPDFAVSAAPGVGGLGVEPDDPAALLPHFGQDMTLGIEVIGPGIPQDDEGGAPVQCVHVMFPESLESCAVVRAGIKVDGRVGKSFMNGLLDFHIFKQGGHLKGLRNKDEASHPVKAILEGVEQGEHEPGGGPYRT